ncbi:MAG: T9SS type A sorting domain-containing protein [Bacteroidia bacterium]
MKRLLISGLIIAASLLPSISHSQIVSQVTFDLTTGLDDATQTLIPYGSPDDTWQVYDPNANSYSQAHSCTTSTNPAQGPGWDQTATCGRWISSCVDQWTGFALNCNPGGHNGPVFYRTQFNLTTACLQNVRLVLNSVGADDAIEFFLNGNSYQVSPTLSTGGWPSAASNPLETGIVININPAHLQIGNNILEARIDDYKRWNGFVICGYFEADQGTVLEDLEPLISMNSTFCAGTPVTAQGSVSAGNIQNHYWEIVESNSSGVPVSGGYSWNNWYSGSPGAITFPNSSQLPCNKYYRVKLAVQTACTPWQETTQVIYVSCTPQPLITASQTICFGSSVTLCVSNVPRGTQIIWNTGAIGNCITVTPNSTTVYSATATNFFGCSAAVSTTVTVLNNNPGFGVNTASVNNNSYYTITANPFITSNLPAGFGYAWFVVELDVNTNAPLNNTQVINSNCWWTGLSTSFPGYDGFNNSTYNGTSTLNCGNPAPNGLFLPGHKYRITRGTWSTVCGWQQYSVVVNLCTNCRSTEPVIEITEDSNAPSMEYLLSTRTSVATESAFNVYPNPSNGNFTVQLDAVADNATAELYNALGERIQTVNISNTSTVVFNNENLAKGIYLIRIINGESVSAKQIIIE